MPFVLHVLQINVFCRDAGFPSSSLSNHSQYYGRVPTNKLWPHLFRETRLAFICKISCKLGLIRFINTFTAFGNKYEVAVPHHKAYKLFPKDITQAKHGTFIICQLFEYSLRYPWLGTTTTASMITIRIGNANCWNCIGTVHYIWAVMIHSTPQSRVSYAVLSPSLHLIRSRVNELQLLCCRRIGLCPCNLLLRPESLLPLLVAAVTNRSSWTPLYNQILPRELVVETDFLPARPRSIYK